MKFWNMIKVTLNMHTSEEGALIPDKEIVQKIVAMQSRGNLNLQHGRYITSADLEEQRKALFS